MPIISHTIAFYTSCKFWMSYVQCLSVQEDMILVYCTLVYYIRFSGGLEQLLKIQDDSQVYMPVLSEMVLSYPKLKTENDWIQKT